MITLGCAKNLYDSEKVLGGLAGAGVEVAHDTEPHPGDTVIVNTCGFIRPAQEESIDTILSLAEARRRGRIRRLIVMGCLVERFADTLQQEIPEVDHWIGANKTDEVIQRLISRPLDNWHHHLLRRPLTPRHYAYLKIAEGCDRPCAFCAIPQMRGRFRSRPIEELVQEARRMADQGVRELIIIAQDTTYYGLDIYGKRRLADLLQAIADIEPLQWIRLHYAFPTGFPMEVLEVMRRHPKICNYLDIPLQHASTPVLQRMRRGITEEKTYQLIDTIRQKNPDIAIRSTFLVGFPGETEDDFQRLLRFIETTRLDRVGVFTYSHEEGTHAFQYADDVPEEVKESRAAALMETQRTISYEKQQALIGRRLPVILDHREENGWIGRTEYDSPEVDNEVWLPAAVEAAPGDFLTVHITAADEYTLTAMPV